MIADVLVSSLTAYLKEGCGTGTALSDVTFNAREEGSDKIYPLVVVMEDGEGEEHGVIKGQWTHSLEVILKTRPDEDESAVVHRSQTAHLNGLLGDDAAVILHLSDFMQCNDSWGGQGATEEEGGLRLTTFRVEIKSALNS